MSCEVTILPFRQHIAHYPGEEQALLPTIEDTTLNDEVALRCATLTAKLSQAPNSVGRSTSLREVMQFCQIPEVYQVFRSFIQTQLEVLQTRPDYDGARANDYEHLLDKIDARYAPKEASLRHNLKMRLRFETHATSGGEFDNKKASMINEMRSIFVKGENNILFQEDGSSSTNPLSYGLLLRGLSAYGTYQEGYAYSVYAGIRSQKFPSREELQRFIKLLKSTGEAMMGPKNGQIMNYLFLTYEAVDCLMQEGYKIQVTRERKPSSIKNPIKDVRFSALGEYKDYFNKVLDYVEKRNQNVIRQLEELEADAAKSEQPTNIFLLMGSGHQNLAYFLPDHLREVTEVSASHNWDQSTIGNQILKMLVEKQDVEEDLWEAGFQEQFR